ncbi:MAG: hypothetical protein M3083_06665 [Actinomycetota bacterium]|nr:hypothetical protein [Actinomycetota bacterium]
MAFSAARTVILDDRLLIEELIVGLAKDQGAFYTTTYWYYRACRAAVLGAGGHLSGPFARLEVAQQEQAILSLLELRSDVSLPQPRSSVPQMARIASRHPQLNLLNLEAVAVGQLLGATLWISTETTRGILPAVLDQEHVPWQTIAVPTS